MNEQRLPDEVLYGKAGYLYSLLFAKKHFEQDNEIDDLITVVCITAIAENRLNVL